MIVNPDTNFGGVCVWFIGMKDRQAVLKHLAYPQAAQQEISGVGPTRHGVGQTV
jgi:hypothetical protein